MKPAARPTNHSISMIIERCDRNRVSSRFCARDRRFRHRARGLVAVGYRYGLRPPHHIEETGPAAPGVPPALGSRSVKGCGMQFAGVRSGPDASVTAIACTSAARTSGAGSSAGCGALVLPNAIAIIIIARPEPPIPSRASPTSLYRSVMATRPETARSPSPCRSGKPASRHLG